MKLPGTRASGQVGFGCVRPAAGDKEVTAVRGEGDGVGVPVHRDLSLYLPGLQVVYVNAGPPHIRSKKQVWVLPGHDVAESPGAGGSDTFHQLPVAGIDPVQGAGGIIGHKKRPAGKDQPPGDAGDLYLGNRFLFRVGKDGDVFGDPIGSGKKVSGRRKGDHF